MINKTSLQRLCKFKEVTHRGQHVALWGGKCCLVTEISTDPAVAQLKHICLFDLFLSDKALAIVGTLIKLLILPV